MLRASVALKRVQGQPLRAEGFRFIWQRFANTSLHIIVMAKMFFTLDEYLLRFD